MTATPGGASPHSPPPACACANLLLANADILHATLLPQHARWRPFFAGLRFVVLDEAHVYRGVFGGHVALALRRLQRVAAAYGSAPQFIAASATVGNPRALFRALVPRLPDAPPGQPPLRRAPLLPGWGGGSGQRTQCDPRAS